MTELKKIFTNIYEKNTWAGKESASGKGSDLENASSFIPELVALLKILKIKTMVDCASGDFNWMKEVLKQLPEVYYSGYDIVEKLIISNNVLYGSDSRNFYTKDITIDPLPPVDLVFCRDCLVHLSFENIRKFLRNFLNSESKYLLMTSFSGNRINKDYDEFETMWRTISFHKEPFNFPDPIETIDENCQQENGNFADKVLILYDREILLKCGI